ncbi:MAG: hypothetical protein DRZ76_02970 [Candidatus Nealsonbacteria bacterium]|nr:MAG: hypothetical protein DRZ76_02970 [Candidatus Nealsonbacteria bacterium]
MLKFYVLSKTVSAGSQESDYFAPEKAVHIKRIIVNERSGTSLENVFLDIDIQGTKITKQPIPATLFQKPWNQLVPLEFDLGKGVKLNFTIKNNLGSDISIDIIIVYEE